MYDLWPCPLIHDADPLKVLCLKLIEILNKGEIVKLSVTYYLAIRVGSTGSFQLIENLSLHCQTMCNFSIQCSEAKTPSELTKNASVQRLNVTVVLNADNPTLWNKFRATVDDNQVLFAWVKWTRSLILYRGVFLAYGSQPSFWGPLALTLSLSLALSLSLSHSLSLILLHWWGEVIDWLSIQSTLSPAPTTRRVGANGRWQGWRKLSWLRCAATL